MNHWAAFNHAWFRKHQKIILWCLNGPLRPLARRILKIHQDCPKDLIVGILPHCYTTKIGVEFQTEFRTNWAFSKRIYWPLRPVWWLMHWWDLLVDAQFPELSFGFTTLTKYPDANSGAVSCDGSVRTWCTSGALAWSAIWDGSGCVPPIGSVSSVVDNITDVVWIQCSPVTDQFTAIYRLIFTFDTSALGSGSSISAATLTLCGSSKADTAGWAPSINVCAASPVSANALEPADYTCLGTTALATAIAYANWTSSNTFTLNSAGLAAINKAGVSKFGVREWTYDGANSAPTWAYSGYCQFGTCMADMGNPAFEPKLIVTYTADTDSPICTITTPTTANTYKTASALINLGGTASDNVAVTSVTWSCDTGGSGTASGTDNWTITGINLATGANIITVTAHDASANTGSDIITVTLDASAPSCTITSPTTGATYATNSSPMNISGVASDNVAVDHVTWSNNRGGSGTCTGTDTWSQAGINLQSGDNVITITAHDAIGNTGSDALTVSYDGTGPTVTITVPTSEATYAVGSDTIALGGTASDPLSGMSTVTWANNRGGSGTAIGTTVWNIPSVQLALGVNVITITGTDAAGNTGTDAITITYVITSKVAKYLVGGYGTTFVYDAAWGDANGSAVVAAQSTDNGVRIESYFLTRRGISPYKSARKTANRVFLTSNFEFIGNVSYRIGVDNEDPLDTAEHTATIDADLSKIEIGLNQQHLKLQLLISDNHSFATEYVALTEKGSVDAP